MYGVYYQHFLFRNHTQRQGPAHPLCLHKVYLWVMDIGHDCCGHSVIHYLTHSLTQNNINLRLGIKIVLSEEPRSQGTLWKLHIGVSPKIGSKQTRIIFYIFLLYLTPKIWYWVKTVFYVKSREWLIFHESKHLCGVWYPRPGSVISKMYCWVFELNRDLAVDTITQKYFKVLVHLLYCQEFLWKSMC